MDRIVLQKIILISTLLPYPHGHYAMVCTKVVNKNLNIGEGASNQDKPTRYCEQGRRSVLDMGMMGGGG